MSILNESKSVLNKITISVKMIEGKNPTYKKCQRTGGGGGKGPILAGKGLLPDIRPAQRLDLKACRPCRA